MNSPCRSSSCRGGGLSTDWHFDATTNTQPFWVYHSTFVGGHSAFEISGYAVSHGGMPNVRFLNDVFSVQHLYSDTSQAFVSGPTMMGSFEYSWAGGGLGYGAPAWFGVHTVAAPNQALWGPSTMPDFAPPPGSAILESALDVSVPFALGSATFAALPGMSPGYYDGTAPDMGAVQSNEVPPCLAGEPRPCGAGDGGVVEGGGGPVGGDGADGGDASASSSPIAPAPSGAGAVREDGGCACRATAGRRGPTSAPGAGSGAVGVGLAAAGFVARRRRRALGRHDAERRRLGE